MPGTKTAVQKSPKVQKFHNFVQKMQGQIESVLPKHLTPERVAKVVLVEASRNPALLECSMPSVAESIMLSAQLGLEPGHTLGHIYFIPYGKKCTPIIGYKGYLELARRSGQVARLDARVVYAGEPFEVSAGLKPDIKHKIRGDVDRSDNKLIAAYAVAILKDGSEYFEVLWRSEIDTTKGRSKAGNSRNSPWNTDYARMARKTAIRALFNGGTVPMSFEIATAIELDGDNEHRPDVGNIIDTPFVELDDDAPMENGGGMSELRGVLDPEGAEA
jgi:recombination protein RecT